MRVTYEVISTKRPGAASGKTSQGKEDSEDCNTQKESVEIYSDATNCAGLRHSAWRLPGVLAQRGTLHSMDAGLGLTVSDPPGPMPQIRTRLVKTPCHPKRISASSILL